MLSRNLISWSDEDLPFDSDTTVGEILSYIVFDVLGPYTKSALFLENMSGIC